MRTEGFYREMDGTEELPSIHDAVGRLEVDDKEALVQYLRDGRGVIVAPTWVVDVLDPEGEAKAGGLGFLTDGEWIWPQALSYYVDRYDVSVSEAFIGHARSNGWAVPELSVDRLTEIADQFVTVE